ncbi:nucleotide exchange factor GrpE, partial [Candidatus Woesearchaeota archaeon]|nr:nucleotide exchange factor GrpE [Candidatus Woesearchaeota archaeon]
MDPVTHTMHSQREEQQRNGGEKLEETRETVAASSLDPHHQKRAPGNPESPRNTASATKKPEMQASEPEKTENSASEKPKEQYAVDELKELVQRTQANFENYRKQTEKRLQDMQEVAAKHLIMQLLPVLDNFELALQNTGAVKNDFINGMELIHRQLLGILDNFGVQPLSLQEGQAFDPYAHEALMKVASDLPENRIVAELQKGYTLHGRLLRPAKVSISAGKKGSAPLPSANAASTTEKNRAETAEHQA